MQNWTPEMWKASLVGLIVGLFVGYLFLRFTKGSVKKQVKTEAELAQVKSQLESQKKQLEQHFAMSADLLKDLAQDYQKLYRHLAQSSTDLLPELAHKPLFSQELLEQQAPQNEANPSTNNSEEEAPRDYSEGSSGILKAER